MTEPEGSIISNQIIGNQIEKRLSQMNNLVEFGRMFLSYGVLILIIAAVGGAAITIGITMAKKKNAKAAAETPAE